MLEKNKQREMILKDNLWKVMIKLSLPAIIAMVLYGLNTIFDAIFVGQFVGENALSGVSLAYPLTQFSIGIGSMIGGGAAAYLSIVIGENNKNIQRRILGNAHFLILVLTVALMIIAWIFARPMIRLMGGSGVVLDLGVDYFRVTVLGTLFWVTGLTYNLIIRAEGKMGTAAIIMASGLVVNIIVNYILMGIFDFGVIGAAWGTNIGMFVYTICSIRYFLSERPSFEANLLNFYRDKDIIKKIISMGMPSLIMTVMMILQGAVILSTISAVGTDFDIAFYGVVFRLYTFMMTPLFATMRSLQPTVGINFGAKNYERVISAVKVYIVGSLLILLPFWLILIIDPTVVLGLMFNSEISQTNIFYYRMFILIIPLLSITMMGMSFFPSINEGKVGSILALLRQLFLYIPMMIILPRLFGIGYVYIGSFLIDLVVTILTGILLTNKFKQLKVL